MGEQKGLPSISLPLQGHSEITEAPWEHASYQSSIPPRRANPKNQTAKAGHDCERDHEHIERIDDERKPTLLEIRRASLGSSTTVDTVEFVRKIATGDRKLPITTASATTQKPPPDHRKRRVRRIGIVCSVLALIALIVIPVICVCILTGVFVPDEAREEHGKVEKPPQKQSDLNQTTTIKTAATTTSRSTADSPDVTWLASVTDSIREKFHTDHPDVTWPSTDSTPTEKSVHYALNTDKPSPDAEAKSAVEVDSWDLISNPPIRRRTLNVETPTTMETRRAHYPLNGS